MARSAGLAGLATLTSRVLGLVRETVIAALFGAGNEIDAYNVAFRVPNLVRDLFAEGAMSAAFVPTLTRRLALGGKDDAWRLANQVITALLLITGLLVVLGWIFAAPLVTVYARPYASVPGKLELTIQLTRLLLPFLTCVSLAAAAMGMLNSLRHYFVPSLSPAAFNVASIALTLALVPLMPSFGQPRVVGLALAALVGGVAQFAVQWPPLRREGFRYRPALDPNDAGLREMLLLMGPGTIGLAATQVNIFINTHLAVAQGTGAVSWLQYAFRLMYLPIGLFGVSIATAVLPAVSHRAAIGDRDGIGRTVSRGIAMMLTVNIPATVGLLLLATPIVEVLFEHGRFLPADTAATASAVRYYAIGLIGYSSARIATPVFYALRRSRTAVYISVTAIVVNAALSYTLSQAMGFRGLALGTSVAAIVNGGLSFFLLRQRLGAIDGRHILDTLGRVLIASVVMAAVVMAVMAAATTVAPGTGLAVRAARLFASILTGVGALAVAAHLLRIEEFSQLVADIRRRG